MAWLESFLAFALTMLVFSTIITIIIEGIHRVLRMREAGLKVLLGNLFDKVIWARFEKLLAPKKQEEARKEFVETLTGNGGMPVTGVVRVVMPKTIASLTSIQFAERLAQTDVGKKIVAKLGNVAEAAAQKADEEIGQVVKDLVQKFERFGADATEYFKRRSQAFAVLIGFGVVAAANFDAVQVFKAYLNDDKLRAALIQTSDAIQKQFLLATEQQKQAAEAGDEAKKTAADFVAQLKKTQADTDKALADLRAKGVPIGWSYYPRCAPRPVPQVPAVPVPGAPAEKSGPTYADARCAAVLAAAPQHIKAECDALVSDEKDPAAKQRRYAECEKEKTERLQTNALGLGAAWSADWKAVVYWALAVLLAGALVGLGGPFWYDTVRSLSSVLQILRPSAPAAAPKPEPGVSFPRVAGQPAETRQPENPVEAFQTAAGAEKRLPTPPTPPADDTSAKTTKN